MSSSENTEREAIIVQVNIYKQMREQLLAKIKIYQLQNKAECTLQMCFSKQKEGKNNCLYHK
jgi:hypothetical protein